MRGTGRHARRARLGATATGFAAVAVAALLVACGSDSSSSDTDAAAGPALVEVTDASFPVRQRLGQTSLLRLDIRNDGDEAIENLTVTVGIVGDGGRISALPFGVRDPQPELANADRPVWVLAATYPRFAGSAEPGGAETSNPKTFAFGTLEPGETTEVIWKLSAVRAGRFRLVYEVGAGVDGGAEAETAEGVAAGGTFIARITATTPQTEVLDNGEVVERTEQR